MRGRLFALAVLAVAAALAGCKRGADASRPAYTDFTDAFYDRPIHQSPSGWTLEGAKALTIVVRGPIHLVVTPEDRADIQLLAGGVAVPADKDADGRLLIGTDAKAPCPMTDAPAETLALRVPRDTALHVEGPAWGDIGAARNLILDTKGCGRWSVAPVAGRLWLAHKGKGAIEAAGAGEVRVRLNGGEVRLGAVEHSLDALLQGGALSVQTLNGNLGAEVQDDGTLEAEAGFVAKSQLFANGSGHIFLRGEAGSVTAEAYGRAKIRVARMHGNAELTGDVEIGRPSAPLTGF